MFWVVSVVSMVSVVGVWLELVSMMLVGFSCR